MSRPHLEAVGCPVVENRRPLTSPLTDTLRSEKLMMAEVPRKGARGLGFKCWSDLTGTGSLFACLFRGASLD